MLLNLLKAILVLSISFPLLNNCATISTNIEQSTHIKDHQLKGLQTKYAKELLGCGNITTYNWSSPEEIHADDLIEICAYLNLLDLPTVQNRPIVDNGKYINNVAPANKVENAIQKHFNVSNDFIKTSKYYNEKTKSYKLIYHTRNLLLIKSVQTEGNIITFNLVNLSDPKVVGKLKATLSPDGIIQYQSLILNNNELLNQIYLNKTIPTNLFTQNSWKNPSEIEPDILYYFFIALARGNDSKYDMIGNNFEAYHPAKMVEDTVKQYIDVSSSHMRKSTHYNKQKNGYSNGGIGSTGSIRVTASSLNNNILTLYYDVFYLENQLLLNGEIKIELLADGFKYLSCHFKRL